MQVDIPDSLFVRLQKHATPLIDTTLSVIEKITAFYEVHNNKLTNEISHKPVPFSSPTELSFDPQNPPSVLYSTVRGDFNGIAFSNWNALLRIAHVQAFNKEKSFIALSNATAAQIHEGKKSRFGFRYIPEIGISLQGVDAVRAWKYALRLAMYLRVPLSAHVEWRQTEEAAHPGERGLLIWTP